MDRTARVVFGALTLAALVAAVGGFAFLFLGGPSEGLARFQGRNFVIGAIVGGVAGLIAGGLLGARTDRSVEESPTV
jgi:large exoprotein involved in heme utilization and adhesion